MLSRKHIALMLFIIATNLSGAYAQPRFRDLHLPAIAFKPVADISNKPSSTGKTTDALPPIVVLPLSCYVAGVNCTVVPVKLLDFSAMRLNDETAGLVWHTENESEISGYFAERSEDGAHYFTDRGFVATDLSAGIRGEYRFNDPNNLTFESYYRLRILHADGSFTYSDVRPVKPVKESSLLIAYPNPARGLVNIRVTAPKGGKALMSWHDAAGRLVLEKNIVLVAGTAVFTEDVTTFAGASYFITIRQEGCPTLKANFYKL